jgi:hypothetical protein
VFVKYFIYDAEILKCIPAKGKPFDPDLEYCKGWRDFQGMGVSCVAGVSSLGDSVIWDSRETLPLDQWFPLEIPIVGFNSKSFDDKLMVVNGVSVQTDYDLLEEIRLAAFGSIRWQGTPRGRSYSLERLGEANGCPKTGSGELAPKLWQRGQYEAVFQYCLNDVKITQILLEKGLEGTLIDPNTGSLLKLRSLEEVVPLVS